MQGCAAGNKCRSSDPRADLQICGSHQNKWRCFMKSMTEFGKLTLVICFVLALVSCAGVPMIQGEKWLDSKQGKPEIDIAGNWQSLEWGAAVFKQNGREVNGTLGDYPAKGVVSGNYVYLMMYSGDRIDYFAELKAADNNTLIGSYSKYHIIDEPQPKDREFIKPVNLKRTGNTP